MVKHMNTFEVELSQKKMITRMLLLAMVVGVVGASVIVYAFAFPDSSSSVIALPSEPHQEAYISTPSQEGLVASPPVANPPSPTGTFGTSLPRPTFGTNPPTFSNPPQPVPAPVPPSEPPAVGGKSLRRIAFFQGLSSSGSSLTTKEMFFVMKGGRNYDPVSRTWGYRDALTGERRNNFLLSWENHRKRSMVNQLLPSQSLYSK